MHKNWVKLFMLEHVLDAYNMDLPPKGGALFTLYRIEIQL